VTRAALAAACTLAGALVASPAQAQTYGDIRDRQRDRDRGLGIDWVWLDAGAGYSWVGVDSIDTSKLQLQSTKIAGPTVSVAAGVRFFFLSVGVRARDQFLSNLNLWELDGEVALRTRFDHFDPYVGLRGGYVFNGALSSGASQAVEGASPSGISIHGWNVGPMIGCDYYFNHFVSLGLDFNGEFLFLERPPVQLPAALTDPMQIAKLPPAQQQAAQAAIAAYRESGSSVGFGANGSLHVGVHF